MLRLSTTNITGNFEICDRVCEARGAYSSGLNVFRYVCRSDNCLHGAVNYLKQMSQKLKKKLSRLIALFERATLFERFFSFSRKNDGHFF